jgi:1-acyl-sn-glycerol-3-phosphate acyltransferase
MGAEVVREDGGYRISARVAKRWELALYRFVWIVLFGFSKTFWRLRVEGSEHLPTDRPFVLAPVHRSNIDFAVVAVVTRRHMRYIAKDSLWKIAPLGRIWSALGGFPVRRGSADREALRTSVEVVEKGEPLVLFPEGTRQHGPVVEEVFDGAAYVAGRAGVPIVPVGIGGSERAMPKGAKVLRPARVAIVIGPPIDPPPAGERGRPGRRAVQDTTARLKVEVQRLFDEAQELAGTPNPRP